MQKKIRKFTVVFEKAEEGEYIATVPLLPGCVTQGETFEETEAMIKDAIKCYCTSLSKHGEPIPNTFFHDAISHNGKYKGIDAPSLFKLFCAKIAILFFDFQYLLPQ